jgi:DNA primase
MESKSYIPENLIEEIRQRASIVEVLSEYVPLKKVGGNYKGLCPFHPEKTPSFTVNPQKGIFHCFGCGVGGNVFSFLMKHKQYTFPEAVELLAKKTGVRLPPRSGRTTDTKALEFQEKLYTLHREVAYHFHHYLVGSQEGQVAREYLKKRGLDENVIKSFLLGYAPPGWDRLRRKFSGYSDEVLLAAGLVIQREKGGGYYDRFRQRLMIPICDDKGRVIAFGGRALGEEEPKYLNSPETLLFSKRNTLFGLHLSKEEIRREGCAILVEGYFDFIMPFSRGIKNLVATLGTSLTAEHLRLLRPYTQKVYLVFDPDVAGVKAVQRTLDLFLSSDIRASVVSLPGGCDPDVAVRELGVEGFKDCLKSAKPLVDFVIDQIVARWDITILDNQIACVNEILPILSKISHEVERIEYLKLAASKIQISDQALLEELKKISFSRSETPKITSKKRKAPSREEYLVVALLWKPDLIATFKDQLDPAYFTDPVLKKVISEVLALEDYPSSLQSKALDLLDREEDRNYLSSLFVKLNRSFTDENVQIIVSDCLKRLKEFQLRSSWPALTRQMLDTYQKKAIEETVLLLEKKREIVRKTQEIFSKE